MNHFEQLARIDVSKHIEKKANLSYLSWAHAVDQLMRQDQTANWVFHEPQMFGESMMVSCTVTAFEKPITMHLPVMDNRNQAIKNPDAFQVNKNMMRCLVKAIACHGLGLYIYAGEDLPHSEPLAEPEPRGKPQLLALLSGMDTENKVKEFRTTLTETERTLIRAEATALINDFRKNQIENKE
jgi:hypothetical protein